MSGLLATGLTGLIASLALLCCLLGIIHTLRATHVSSSPSASAPDAFATAICSACRGSLSGLESHCPTCGKRLRYQVPIRT